MNSTPIVAVRAAGAVVHVATASAVNSSVKLFLTSVWRVRVLRTAFHVLAAAVAAASLSSCAGTYRPVQPRTITYLSHGSSEGLSYSYQFDVLSKARNKKYVKKERKKGIKLVAVKLTNHTDKPISIIDDIKIYSGDHRLLPMESRQVVRELKQVAGLYMLWGMFWVYITDCAGDNCTITPLPVGLVIGGINTAVASSANKKFREEVLANDILTKVIRPGETEYGLLGLSADVSRTLEFRID